MVFLGAKRSLTDASCCRDEVVNGGYGFRLISFLEISETLKSFVLRSPIISSASVSFSILGSSPLNLKEVSFFDISFDSNILFLSLSLKLERMLQYSTGTNFLISSSRSQISLRATD